MLAVAIGVYSQSLEDEGVASAQKVTGSGLAGGHAIEVVHVEEIQRVTASEADFRAGVMQRADPSLAIHAAEDLVHQVGGKGTVRSLVLPAETGSERVAERFGGRAARRQGLRASTFL